MTIQQLLHAAKQRLVTVTNSPMFEAEILLAYVLQKPRSYLYANGEQIITMADEQCFADCVRRRCCKEPVAYITGVREFWSLELTVNSETLIPRPETELLVERVLSLFADNVSVVAADLGTGSGAIALALQSERPLWQIYATDISDSALSVARKNARQLQLNQVLFCQGCWCEALPANKQMDVIVSNPPYIADNEWGEYAESLAFEPRLALTSGEQGLDAINTISREAWRYLKDGGYILLEHGWLQGQAVRNILKSDGYGEIFSFCDLSGRERVTVGRYLKK